MSKKVLIPYFLAGSGHFAIAQAIEYYLRESGKDLEIRFLEPGEEFKDKRLNDFFKQAWKLILKMRKAPREILFGIDKAVPSLSSFINEQYLRTAIFKGMGFLAGYRPDLIISTHWGCTQLFNEARKKMEMDIPLFSVFTELAGGHKLINCGADLYFVMTDEALENLMRFDIPKEKIKRVNFIVRPQFECNKLSRKEARDRLNLPDSAFVLLFSMGGEGIGPAFQYINRFLQIFPEGKMLILTGRNEKLTNEIKKKYQDEGISVFPYRDDVEVLVAASDVLAGKCGGSFSTEAIKTRSPFIITQIGAPNERPNMKYIIKHNYGWYTSSPRKFARILEQIHSDRSCLESVKRNLDNVPEENGASEIASYIISIIL